MTSDAQEPVFLGRGRQIFIATLFTFFVVLVGFLGRAVVNDLRLLSVAQNDALSWNFTQLEVEFLQTQLAAAKVDVNDPDSLAEFRLNFDIFYSRVSSMSSSERARSVAFDVTGTSNMEAASTFLDDVTPLIDGPDDVLMGAMPEISDRLSALHPEIRQLSLDSLTYFANNERTRRDALSRTLIELIVSTVVLVLALMLLAYYLFRLHRQSVRFANDGRALRTRLEAAVNSSLDAVLVYDTEGRLVEFNGSAETMFGHARADVLGQNVALLTIPEHLRTRYRRTIGQLLGNKGRRFLTQKRIRFQAIRKNGEEFPIEFSVALAETAGQQVYVSFVRDITHELQAEEDLRDALDKAKEGEKAKSNLLTVMSHEMRTPLNGILGSLELIDQTDMTADQRQHLKSIAVSGELLLSHVNDVLDLSSLAAGQRGSDKKRFLLQDLVGNVADSLMANAKAHGNRVDIHILGEPMPVVFGEKTALQQCLVNLLGNAIKFTRDGVVTIEVENLQSDNLYEIRVSDEGVGIAEDNLARIFDEFVTIDTAFDRSNTGTGLGLAITKRLVESMGGEIEADSVLGEGSLFTVRVPLETAEEPQRTYHAGKPNKVENFGEGLSALVVDDNQINRMILTAMLKELGFTVSEAADGYEAVQKVSDARFDVVLLDISMPGIDGIETLARIRNLDRPWCFVPAVSVTANASKEDHARILDQHFSALLLKPIELRQVSATLANVLGLETKVASDGEDIPPAARDFIDRFGQETYLIQCQTLYDELMALWGNLTNEQGIGRANRDLAHKLAGSAGVLGQMSLHAVMQDVENISESEFESNRRKTLDLIRAEADRLRDLCSRQLSFD